MISYDIFKSKGLFELYVAHKFRIYNYILHVPFIYVCHLSTRTFGGQAHCRYAVWTLLWYHFALDKYTSDCDLFWAFFHDSGRFYNTRKMHLRVLKIQTFPSRGPLDPCQSFVPSALEAAVKAHQMHTFSMWLPSFINRAWGTPTVIF